MRCFSVSLVCVLCVVGLLAAPAYPSYYVGSVRYLAPNTAASDSWPDVFKDRVVWADVRNQATAGLDIYMKNLYTGVEVKICGAAGDQKEPAIFGDRIVWQDNRRGNWDIYMYDLATATETLICYNDAIQERPRIFGDRIVWQDNRSGNYGVYMYDCATHVEAVVCDRTGDQKAPAIWGHRVVWMDSYPSVQYDIYMRDLTAESATPTAICTAVNMQVWPAIWGDWIVWNDWRSGDSDIYLKDLSRNVEVPICTWPGWQRFPDIHGTLIVWEDLRNKTPLYDQNSDIYKYDLADGFPQAPVEGTPAIQDDYCELVHVQSLHAQMKPAVWGDRIVCLDHRTDISPYYTWDVATLDLDRAIGEAQITGRQDGTEDRAVRPSVWGHRIVWRDSRNVDAEHPNNYDIYMGVYDSLNETTTESPICTNLGNQDLPRIDGNRIVWQDDRNGNWDIYMYDLTDGTEYPICINTANQQRPCIYGDRIVWQDDRNGNLDVYMYDLSTETESEVCTAAGNQQECAIWGDRVVWVDCRTTGDGPGIYMRTLPTGSPEFVCTSGTEQRYPDIWHDVIVYQSWNDLPTGWNVYMYDLALSLHSVVSNTNSTECRAKVWDHTIVWMDSRNGSDEVPNWDIYKCDLQTYDPEHPLNSTVLVCGRTGNQWYPAIWGDRIVWYDSPAQDQNVGDVYMHKLAICSFDDVPRTHMFWAHIEAIYYKRCTVGVNNRPYLFQPGLVLSRSTAAAFIAHAQFEFTLVPPWYAHWPGTFDTPLGDVPSGGDGTWPACPEPNEATHPYYGYIERLVHGEFWLPPLFVPPATGYPSEHKFYPNVAVTRAQMAKWICIAKQEDPWYDPGVARFTDVPRGNAVWNPPPGVPVEDGECGGVGVPPDRPTVDGDGTHWAYGWIERFCDNASWGQYGAPSAGVGGGLYAPENSCLRGQGAVMVQHAWEFALPVK